MLRRTLLPLLTCGLFAHAGVVRVDVANRADTPGNAGYERVSGKVFFAVDPKLPANRAIADIDLARQAAVRESFPALAHRTFAQGSSAP